MIGEREMYTPESKEEVVIVRDVDGTYQIAEYLGATDDTGEHFKVQRLTGPETTSFPHYEDIYELNDENRRRFL